MTRHDPIAALAAARHEFGEHGGVNMSIETSSTFTVLDPHTMPDLFSGRLGPDTDRQGCYLYGRHFNPTVYALGRQLAALEGTEAAYGAASGMGAIASVLMQVCRAGDHVVASRTIYGGTFALLHDFLPERAGVSTTFVDATDLAAVEAAVEPRTRVLFVETLSNPTLAVADIPRLAAIAHRHDALLVVDNTFAPVLVAPAQLGADVVVHSMTKFLSGASDLIAGAVCGTADFVRSMMDVHTGALMLLGPTLDPRIAFELSVRLPHLGLRMREHSHRAMTFAVRLRELGLDVRYPGLESHPQHALMQRMLTDEEFGFGGVLGLNVPDPEVANRLLDELQNREKFGWIAVSLGYFDTLMSVSAASTSSELGSDELKAAGIKPGYVRISVGFTGTLEQRWLQFEHALRRVGLIGASSGPRLVR
ncbi:MAG: aminotransferase class I/II-fold pyridoxal phosphate-dependent enzyme [Planctomycetota bacterium]|nr:aminotransferase class I/II-fold pyridoxal phosphate-dependent enzyme [Planctomycetota bacterium]MDA0934278.1 aminotransferase class I/II-fold pyridoxal phosphate-dependent enzyme [Planctomycetota bacterium]